ncbi:MAG: peptidoglycan-binding domain-containing protein [bacterium]|nr:peptidoglycan-binding domain-containing protein [bacterium]
MLICVLFPLAVRADTLLEKKDFYVDPFYDLAGRATTTAVLQSITNQLYFYLDNNWWESLDINKRKEVNIAIDNLAKEFEATIYPTLTLAYGSEWKPGIDGDEKITILIHPMIEGAAGYFNPGDEYPKAQVPTSNQREMLYLSSGHITNAVSKSFLAHEFTHLITFNQKDRTYGVSEDVWLNEARAEYSPSLLGYDKIYEGSNLKRRVEQFLEMSQDSLTEWQGKKSDYGALNLFTQYLVDQYGFSILSDSLKSETTGIASLNSVLKKKGFSDDFSQIFTNWTIAIYLNNCAIGQKYCYLNDNLKGLKITPFIYFLPTVGDSTLNVGYLTKDWAGNWQKIIGGRTSLKLEFIGGSANVNFKVPYIIEGPQGVFSVKFLALDQSKKGTVFIEDGKIVSVTIIPSSQTKIAGFGNNEPLYQFSWSASTERAQNEENNLGETELIQQLQAKINELRAEVSRLQAQLGVSGVSCQKFETNLYYGMKANANVNCLQKFLKEQGQNIYPEGLVTGNFLSATKAAVIRFQEKYAADILVPLGLERGTGFTGQSTRTKINKLLNFK